MNVDIVYGIRDRVTGEFFDKHCTRRILLEQIGRDCIYNSAAPCKSIITRWKQWAENYRKRLDQPQVTYTQDNINYFQTEWTRYMTAINNADIIKFERIWNPVEVVPR